MIRTFPAFFRIALVSLFLGGTYSEAQQGKRAAKAIPITQIKIDSVEFQDADLPTVLDFLGEKARENNGTPANFLLYDPLGEIRQRNPQVSLSLKDIPLSQVLKYVSDLSGTSVQVDAHAALFLQKKDLVLLKKLRSSRLNLQIGKNQIAQLGAITVPQIELQDMTLSSAIEFLRLKTWESCAPGSPPNFVIQPSANVDLDATPFSLKLNNASLLTTLQYITEMAGCTLRFDQRVIAIGLPGDLSSAKPIIRQKNPQFNLILNSRIAEVEMEDATLSEALEVLSYYARDPKIAPQGPNFITTVQTKKTVTLHLRKIRGIDLLRYLNEQTGTNFRVEQNVIAIIDRPAAKPKAKPKVN